VVLGVSALCLHALFPEDPTPAAQSSRVPAPASAVDSRATRAETATRLAALAGQGPIRVEAPRSAPPPSELPANDDPGHPHPITPAHERLFRENNFIAGLNTAMDVKDALGMRRLLARYRAEYPEDGLALQAGYALIADCLEHPGADSAAVARRYYETETGSTLRRHVRRHCLTAEQAP
jgi:hypothetical protein